MKASLPVRRVLMGAQAPLRGAGMSHYLLAGTGLATRQEAMLLRLGYVAAKASKHLPAHPSRRVSMLRRGCPARTSGRPHGLTGSRA